MASDSRVGRFQLLNRPLDRDAAIAGLLLSALLVPLRFLSSQIFIQSIPLVLASACFLYLLARRLDTGAGDYGYPTLPRWGAQVLPALVFVGLAAMVVIATLAGGRTLLFYDVAGLVGTFVLAQFVFVDDEDFHPPVLLAQLLAAAFVVRFAALLTTPGYIGRDIWTHIGYAQMIAGERSLGAIGRTKYYAAPLYHLLVATTSILTDVTLRHALFASMGVVMPLIALPAFAVTREFVTPRWALVAAGLFLFSDEVIRWGLHLIPTSLGLLFFAFVVWYLIRILLNEAGVRDYALFVFFSVAVILTHQLSAFVMLVVLGCGVLAELIEPLWLGPPSLGEQRVSDGLVDRFTLLPLFGLDFLVTIVVWAVTPFSASQGTFLVGMVNVFVDTTRSTAGFLNLVGGASGGAPTPTQQATGWLLPLIENFGFFVLLFATFIGSLVVCQRSRRTTAGFGLLVASAAMLAFVFVLPLFGIRSFVPTRWYAFAMLPMVVLAAQGIRYLAARLTPKAAVAILVAVIVLFPNAMIIAHDATLDNPVFPNEQERLAYNQQELSALQTIETEFPRPSDEPIYTDNPYNDVFQRTGYPAQAPVVVPGQPISEDVLLYRAYQSTGASYFRSGPDGPGVIRDVPRQRFCGADRSVVYTNGRVSLCTAVDA